MAEKLISSRIYIYASTFKISCSYVEQFGLQVVHEKLLIAISQITLIAISKKITTF